jgi:hypothetical protein
MDRAPAISAFTSTTLKTLGLAYQYCLKNIGQSLHHPRLQAFTAA